jgi:DNA-binding beta-propeller fold protein YncE
MYRLAATIPNDIALNLIPEVAFRPDGSLFAVSHQQANEVVVYDAHSRDMVRVFRNPSAGLDNPHGVLMSDHFLIVSNTHGVTRPSSFSVHRIDDPSDQPISTFVTPYSHLREAHSLALRGGMLVATYCQNVAGPGAIVTYRFDADSGAISGPTALLEDCFREYGQPKGVAFSNDGRELFVTYATQKRMTGLANYARRVKSTRLMWRKRNIAEFARFVVARLKRRLQAMLAPPALKNGVAVFSVDDAGTVSATPVRILERPEFCRLENIDIVGERAVLCDTINGRVYLHDLARDPQLQSPVQEIAEGVVLPHGAKLSPDESMLVVTNYGLKVENEIIHWMTPAQDYTNSVLVYDRCA